MIAVNAAIFGCIAAFRAAFMSRGEIHTINDRLGRKVSHNVVLPWVVNMVGLRNVANQFTPGVDDPRPGFWVPLREPLAIFDAPRQGMKLGGFG